MGLAQQRKNCAPSSRNPSPNGSSPTPSSSSTPFPAPPSANLRKSPSANSSQIGSGTNRTGGTPLAAAIGAELAHLRCPAQPQFMSSGRYSYTFPLNGLQQFSPL